MELVELTDEYKTGIQSVDYEHQKLINYMNEIIKASDMGDSARLLIEINIDELLNYTNFHFRAEEELMEKHNYADFESHKRAHQKLKEEVINYKNRFGNNEDIAVELVAFLKDWLFNHIKATDLKYVKVFKENNVA